MPFNVTGFADRNDIARLIAIAYAPELVGRPAIAAGAKESARGRELLGRALRK
jgi:hypothetical protein